VADYDVTCDDSNVCRTHPCQLLKRPLTHVI
jgi:hypothetical protein